MLSPKDKGKKDNDIFEDTRPLSRLSPSSIIHQIEDRNGVRNIGVGSSSAALHPPFLPLLLYLIIMRRG